MFLTNKRGHPDPRYARLGKNRCSVQVSGSKLKSLGESGLQGLFCSMYVRMKILLTYCKRALVNHFHQGMSILNQILGLGSYVYPALRIWVAPCR